MAPHAHLIPAGLFLLLAACDAEPSWESCADAACYTQLAVERWSTDPDGVAADVAALDVVAQEAVVLALVDAHPTALSAICESLPKGPASKRCAKLTERPHLLGGKANAKLRQVGVPGLVDHTGIEQLGSPWTEVPAAEASCDMQLDDCWNKAMVGAVQTEDPAAVAAVCNGVPSDRFRRECFFRGAETMAVQQAKARVERLPTAAALCLGAEDYNELCVRELGRAIARLAPPADQADPSAWQTTAAAVAALEQGLEPYDAAVAERVADRVWSAVIWGSYQRAELLTGLPGLPDAAGPHARATLAWFLVQREADPGRDLAAWIARAREAQAATATATATASDAEQGVQPTRFYGNSADPASEPEPWVHYLGDNYRQLLDDPDQDLIACLLEAAVRQDRQDLLAPAAVEDLDPALQAWAARLLALEIRAPRGPGKPPPPGTPKGRKAPPPPR